MHAQLVSEADLPAWQDFVDRNREAGCMHHAGWYGVLRDACWVTPYFLMAINEQGAIEGILPTYFSSSPLTGRHISSFEDGVLAATTEAANALLTEARSLRDRTGSRYLQIRGGASIGPPTSSSRLCAPSSRQRHQLSIWAAVQKKTRWAVRQAGTAGLKHRARCFVAGDEQLLCRLRGAYARPWHSGFRCRSVRGYGHPFGRRAVAPLSRQARRAPDRRHVVHRHRPSVDRLLYRRPAITRHEFRQSPPPLARYLRRCAVAALSASTWGEARRAVTSTSSSKNGAAPTSKSPITSTCDPAPGRGNLGFSRQKLRQERVAKMLVDATAIRHQSAGSR